MGSGSIGKHGQCMFATSAVLRAEKQVGTVQTVEQGWRIKPDKRGSVTEFACSGRVLWVTHGRITGKKSWLAVQNKRRTKNDSNTNPTGDYHRTAYRDMDRAFDEGVKE